MRDAPYVSTTNACKLCTPMGAALAFKGVEGCVPFLHGSQGCATYMRRYIISHFREPVDIASSALGENHAVFGGGPNLKKGILNVMRKYDPAVVGVASTCLTETIGDDVPGLLHEFRHEFDDLDLPEIVSVSTPSYSGTHMDGFYGAVRSLTEGLAGDRVVRPGAVGLFPGFISPADTRCLRRVLQDYGVDPVILPDISETLDGGAFEEYMPISPGGTPVSFIRALPSVSGCIEFGRTLKNSDTAGAYLERSFGMEVHRIGLPVGIRECDAFFGALSAVTGRNMPAQYALDRGRLVDAYVDGHKYVSGKRAAVYGEEDLVVALVSFLSEIGVKVVLAATGGKSKLFESEIQALCADVDAEMPEMKQGADFHDIGEALQAAQPDLLLGHSKGYRYARDLGVPLVRVGFPIHDRFGGRRVRMCGYSGTIELYDRIADALLEVQQTSNIVGYGYL